MSFGSNDLQLFPKKYGMPLCVQRISRIMGWRKEVEVIVEIKVMLDDGIPEQAALLRQLLGLATNAPAGVPHEFISAVRGTKVGRTIVVPLASQMVVNQRYKPQDLADLLDLEARVLGKRFTVLGRTEQRFGGLRIFTRHGDGREREYSISESMKQAFGEERDET